jgi:hypothetical protein
MTKNEMKKEAQENIDQLVPVVEMVAEMLDENEELLDWVVDLYGKTIVRVIGRVMAQVPDEMIEASAKKRALYLGCLFDSLVLDHGFSETEAIRIIAGQNR